MALYYYTLSCFDTPGDLIGIAVSLLREGNLIILPTDTGYALCGNILESRTLRRIYSIKGRPSSKPVSLLLPDAAEIPTLAVMDSYIERICSTFLPGPLTVVLPAHESVSLHLTSKEGTVALRVPALPFPRLIAKRLGAPLSATSANPSGAPPPFSSAELLAVAELLDVEAVFDAGTTPYGRSSTIVKLLPGSRPQLLRAGPLAFETICSLYNALQER